MAARKSNDPFAKVRATTLAHRAKHGCGTWPYENGPLLGTLAAAIGARRILELGTALGYTALSFARGAPEASIDTVERDAEHVRLARGNITAAGWRTVSMCTTATSPTCCRR
jgi:predicted O-methyltransferase YrrM